MYAPGKTLTRDRNTQSHASPFRFGRLETFVLFCVVLRRVWWAIWPG